MCKSTSVLEQHTLVAKIILYVEVNYNFTATSFQIYRLTGDILIQSDIKIEKTGTIHLSYLRVKKIGY